jgi:hypothetical protein
MTSPRPDTRVLVTTPITTDLSQWLTDLTASGAGAFEDPAARAAIDGTGDGRSLELIADIDNVQIGWLVRHGEDAANQPYGIKVVAGGAVEFWGDVTVLASISAPSVGGAAASYVVAWSTEPNPQTTGAGDALRSEALVYNVGTTELAWVTFVHAVYTADVAGAFSIGGAWDGGALLEPYAPSIDAVRVSARWHTRVETREHFIAQTPAPTILGITAVEAPVVPVDATTAKREPGTVYQAAAGAMATGRNRHRAVSPLVHVLVPQPWPVFGNNQRDALSTKWVHDIGDGWQTPISWLWRRKIPRHTHYIRVEIQWATWATDVNPPDVAELRIYTANARPQLATDKVFRGISRAVEDGVGGPGVRQMFEHCPVKRTDANDIEGEGYTWVFLAARTDAGSGVGNVAYSVRGVTIVPVSVGLGFDIDEPPDEWGP